MLSVTCYILLILFQKNKQATKTPVDVCIDFILILIPQSGRAPLTYLCFLMEQEHNLDISSSNPQGGFMSQP